MRTATNLLPPQGDGEINERTFVKFALILAWKEHFSPKYKGDDSLIRSSGFSGRHTQVLFLTLGSSLKPRGKCAAELRLGNQDLDVLGVASFAHPCRDEINPRALEENFLGLEGMPLQMMGAEEGDEGIHP